MKKLSAVAGFLAEVYIPVTILFIALFTSSSSERYLLDAFCAYLSIISAVVSYLMWAGSLNESSHRHEKITAVIFLILCVALSFFLISKVFFTGIKDVNVLILFYVYISTLATLVVQHKQVGPKLKAKERILIFTVFAVGMCWASIALFIPIINQSYSFLLLQMFLVAMIVPVLFVNVIHLLEELSIISIATYNKFCSSFGVGMLGAGLMIFTISAILSEFIELI